MHKKIWLSLLIGFATQHALALTMPEAIEQAVLRNPEIQVRWHQYLAAGEEMDAAKSGYLPKVDANAYMGRERQNYPLSGSKTYTHPGASLELRQMLFDGYATRDEVRRGGYVKQTRYYDLLAASDAIALETARAYLDVQRYRILTDLARDNWATHKEFYDQIAERVQAGVGRRVDLEQAAGRVALAESNWLTEASNLHDVSSRYERLVGKQPDKIMPDMPPLADKLPKPADTLPLALSQNPLFLSAVANLRAARAQMTLHKSANYPTLDLRASSSLDRNRDGGDGSYRKDMIQLNLNYNLYRGGGDSAKIRAAGQQLDASFSNRDKTCRDIRQETRIAHNDARRLAEQIKYLEQHQLSTEKARDAYRQQFDIGQRTLLDVLDTENELFEAKRALVRAEFDQQLAQVRVLTQTHQILPALNLAPIEPAIPNDDLGGAELEDAKIACGTDDQATVTLDREAALAARPKRPTPALPPANRQTAVATAPAKPVLPASTQSAAQTCTVTEKEVLNFLDSWVEAWSNKGLDSYLSFFSKRFVAPKQQPIDEWKPMRKSRLAKIGPITIKVENAIPKITGADSAEVSFKQFYSADGFVDNVDKTLDLVVEDCKLKILHERVTKGRIY